MANDNPKRKSNKTKGERRFWSRRLVVPLFLLFLMIWVAVFSALQIQNIQAPVKYVRQNYPLQLTDQYGEEFGTIIMNCFDLPMFLSAFMMYRQVEVHEDVLLRKDSFVCNFDYGLLNRTATIANATIWFVNVDSDFVMEQLLHVNETGEQIIFPMPFSGWYTFEVWLLPTIYIGWEEVVFRHLNFYVYESPQSYAQAQSAYSEALASVLGSIVGSIIGALGIVLAGMEPYRTSKGYQKDRTLGQRKDV